ncbi:hypothetical protein K438DRAFT_1551319, partial [Mycena galopus ATCC 62051]
VSGEKRQIWRIAHSGTEDGDLEEFTFRMQGILVHFNLPTIQVNAFHRTPPGKLVNLSQQVTLSGLSSPDFDSAVHNLSQMEAMFSRWFSTSLDNRLGTTQAGSHLELTASNRYFTLKSEEPSAERVEFLPGVDPLGQLEKASTKDFFHTANNKVAYFKKVQD